MKNQCFLHKKKPEIIYSENLDLFNFGKLKLSYGLCKDCGHIFQTESANKSQMKNHYKKLLMYLDNLSKPSNDKIKNVSRHISMIKQEFKTFPEKVLEVSSMNSYTLKQYKNNGSKIIFALEPNSRVSKLLRKDRIRVFNMEIEKFKSNKKFDLIILTHVLEHLFNPLSALKKCNNVQKEGQKILVEVPLFEKVENYTIGSMHLEHLHYFSENNLIQLITLAGYEIDNISKIFKSTEFPFITIVATKRKGLKGLNTNNYNQNLVSLKRYIKNSKLNWKKIKKKINKIPSNKNIYLYGAGSFTSQLIFHTGLNQKRISGILDGSKIKQNKYIGNYKILSPDVKNIKKNSVIAISSATCQESIYDDIKYYKNFGHQIIKLFETRSIIYKI